MHYGWINGAISQISGYINSCPATNSSIFGINIPMTLGVQGIMDLIDLPNKPSYAKVMTELRRSLTINSEGQVSEELRFNETLDGSKKTTPLEDEILPNLITREVVGRLVVGESGYIPPATPTMEDLKKHLTPFEIIRYEQAGKVGARDVLRDLNSKVLVSMQNLKADEKLMEEEPALVEENVAKDNDGTMQATVLKSNTRSGQRKHKTTQNSD
jgi:hypothetical protein